MSSFRLGSITVGVLQGFAHILSAAEPNSIVNIRLNDKQEQTKMISVRKLKSNYTALLLADFLR
jgi:hypothetical protein